MRIIKNNDIVISGYANNIAYVDLGLPSNIKWAISNVGATYINEAGLFYQYGGEKGTPLNGYGSESGLKRFDISSFKFIPETINKTEYNDGDVLSVEDDIINISYGDKWFTPTKENVAELLENTTNEWVQSELIENDIKITTHGRLFTSKINGNTMYIPAGFLYVGENSCFYSWPCAGGIWTSSLLEDDKYVAYTLMYDENFCGLTPIFRFEGINLRAVYKK